MEIEQKKPEKSNLRKYWNLFLTGLVAILPMAATVWVLRFIYLSIAGPVAGPLSIIFGHIVPKTVINLVSFVLTIVLILFIGYLTRNYIGKTLLNRFDKWFSSIPFVSTIYNSTKQIIDAFSLQNKMAFKRVVIVEYPRKGLFTLGFLTKSELHIETPDGKKVTEKMVNAFLPTTPNPTSGYFVMVPEEDVIPVNVSIEDAIKMIVSAGALTPKR